jgi:hypothetical protein
VSARGWPASRSTDTWSSRRRSCQRAFFASLATAQSLRRASWWDRGRVRARLHRRGRPASSGTRRGVSMSAAACRSASSCSQCARDGRDAGLRYADLGGAVVAGEPALELHEAPFLNRAQVSREVTLRQPREGLQEGEGRGATHGQRGQDREPCGLVAPLSRTASSVKNSLVDMECPGMARQCPGQE